MIKTLVLALLLLTTLNNPLRSQAFWESNLLYDRIIRDLYSANDNLYSLTDDGIYFSKDGGNFWSCMRISNASVNWDCYTITNMENQIFLGTRYFGIYSTTNDGNTWTVLNDGLGGASVYKLLTKGSLLIAGSNDNGIFISSNRGITWTTSNSGLTNLQVRSLINDGDKIFTGTTGGVFLSTDNGATWVSRSVGLPSSSVESFFLNNGNLYAGLGNGRVYLSSNSGQNWISRSNGLGSRAVEGFASAGNYIFAGTHTGVYRIPISGTIWSPVNSGLGSTPQVNSLIVSDDKLFAGIELNPKGLYFTTNLGDNWGEQNSGLTYGRLNCLNGTGNSIYTADWIFGTSIYKTDNNSSSWTNTGSVNSSGVLNSIAFKSPYIFAATSGDGIYRSPDSAFNWNRISPVDIPSTIYEIIIKDEFVFAVSAESGIFRTSNDGNNWISVNNGLTSFYIRDITISGNNLLAGTGGGIFYSSDNGISWNKSSNSSISSLVTTGSFTYSSGAKGLYISSNNGLSWEERDSSMDFTAMSGNENYLFGSSHLKGILVSYDKGLNWNNCSYGFLSIPDIANFYINDDYIFASTAYNGVYRLKMTDLIGVSNAAQEVPENYFLFQNYPNPFNPRTKIKFEIQMNSFVKLKVYNLLGKEIKILINKSMNPGIYTTDFDGSNLSSGVYFFKIEVTDFYTGKLMYVKANKMLLLK